MVLYSIAQCVTTLHYYDTGELAGFSTLLFTKSESGQYHIIDSIVLFACKENGGCVGDLLLLKKEAQVPPKCSQSLYLFVMFCLFHLMFGVFCLRRDSYFAL